MKSVFLKAGIVGKLVRRLALAGLCLAGFSGSSYADDTEIYRANYSASASGRPQVLIIFDNSRSMAVTTLNEPADYDPNESYVDSGFDNERIYWLEYVDGEGVDPRDIDPDNYFPAARNRCSQSYGALAEQGFFTSKARRWQQAGAEQNAGWFPLTREDVDPFHVDCEADIITPGDPSNGSGVSQGYPQSAAQGDTPDSDAYTAERVDSDINWNADSPVALYTGHYLNFINDTTLPSVQRTRLDVAQGVVTSLISANPTIDFGLAVFNHNNPVDFYDGGRIVQRIIPGMSDADRDGLLTMVDGLAGTTSTPLCESTYEVYRYLAGLGVEFGTRQDATDAPDRDLLAESGGQYLSPVAECAQTYIILMTDGDPQQDQRANQAIKDLTGSDCGSYPAFQSGENQENCLPELAGYLATTDLDQDDSNGTQVVHTYTIGFTDQQDLLRDTAMQGGGDYYSAQDGRGLTAAFQSAILGMLSIGTTSTSPTAAVDTFTRTRSREEVFYAMFEPNDKQDWPGNIKKLNLSIVDGEATLVDANGVAAFFNGGGQIRTTATTVWSTEVDGPEVQKGGVGGLLAVRRPSTRVLYTNAGVDALDNPTDRLTAFTPANIKASAYGFTTDQELYDFYGVADRAELDSVLNWAAGYSEALDGSPVDTSRGWLLADILHSQPLVVNYGARGSFTEDNPELRILVGTNAGFFHMFHNGGSDAGEEAWAFFAKELGAVLNQRKLNAPTSQHVYGVDSPPVLYTIDLDKDGTIDSTAGDKAYVFFGLRRGGRILYGLDISDPDDPRFLWKIDNNSPGFAELGYTWSVPEITRIPGYADDNGVAKPVLVFGAGYDPVKDGNGLVTDTTDTMGRGIFVVDAISGELVWGITPGINSASNMQETGLAHSVVGSVSVMDSNGDGLSDRFYFADTGASVWRVDLPGDQLPGTSQNRWMVVELANLNGGTAATDRRFFNGPDVAPTLYGGVPYDAIMIGSGDRTNPNGTDVDNQFYMIRDTAITPYFDPIPADCSDPSVDFRCELPLDASDLFDVTSEAQFEEGTLDQQLAARNSVLAANGWRLDLEAVGEKSLSRSITIAGRIFFTTFSPDPVEENVCVPNPGDGRLYAIGLPYGLATQSFGDENDYQRSWIIGSLIPDTPSPHFGSDGEIRLLLPPGAGGQGGAGNPFLTGASLQRPFGSYWYREEY